MHMWSLILGGICGYEVTEALPVIEFQEPHA